MTLLEVLVDIEDGCQQDGEHDPEVFQILA
jgi:hypothetical protein